MNNVIRNVASFGIGCALAYGSLGFISLAASVPIPEFLHSETMLYIVIFTDALIALIASVATLLLMAIYRMVFGRQSLQEAVCTILPIFLYLGYFAFEGLSGMATVLVPVFLPMILIVLLPLLRKPVVAEEAL